MAHAPRRGDHAHPRTERAPRPRLASGIALAVVAVLAGAGLRLVVGAGGANATDRPPASAPAQVVDSAMPPGPGLARAASGAAPTAGDDDRAPALPASPSTVAVPVCRYADEPAPHAGVDEWASTIVDTIEALPDDYVPPDLVPVGRAGIAGSGLIRSLVIGDLRDLAEAAADAGNPIAVASAYRSRERQASVFASWVAQSGEADARRFSARPGHSEHELGTALDVRAAAGGAPWTGSFGATAAGRWIEGHASEYGFVLSYPAGAQDLTCYGAEPWHLRYVGRERAAAVAASGLTLREWLWAHVGG
jgi:zinc D-Ala-D-Ala carboxypeptidase